MGHKPFNSTSNANVKNAHLEAEDMAHLVQMLAIRHEDLNKSPV